MKFGELTKYSVRNIFLQKSCRKWGIGLVLNTFLFFKKASCKVKTVVIALVSMVDFDIKQYKLYNISSRDMLSFDSL